MNSTIPVDLLELKARFETWRTNRKDEIFGTDSSLTRIGALLSDQLSQPAAPAGSRRAAPHLSAAA
jgi:hypothetical protein